MYILYSNKINHFEAQIEVEGASLKKTKCRLVLEGKNSNLMYYGTIDSDGLVKIPIKEGLIPNKRGSARLEIIADNTYFVPWEDVYEIETPTKVLAEVQQNPGKVKVKLKEKVVNEFKTFLKGKKITQNIIFNRLPLPTFEKLIEGYIKFNKLNIKDTQKIYSNMTKIITSLPIK